MISSLVRTHLYFAFTLYPIGYDEEPKKKESISDEVGIESKGSLTTQPTPYKPDLVVFKTGIDGLSEIFIAHGERRCHG
jgi:hypothetical protein